MARPRRLHPFRVPALLAALAIGPLLAACGDDDPFGFNDWALSPDTAFLYSLARPELNLESGFNLNSRRVIRVEAAGATGTWDFLVNTAGNELVFITPTGVGLETNAGIARIDDETFESIRVAPADTSAYERLEPVSVELGQLYVVRTNQQTGSFGQNCTYYGKVEPIEIDVSGGTIRFRYDSNPICNSRDLVPPEE